MNDLSPQLLRAQRAQYIPPENLLLRCVLTYTGATSYTYTKTKIKRLSLTRQTWSHLSQVLLEDADKSLHGLNLEGYKAVISAGLITSLGEEWEDFPPLWVVGQDKDSSPENLECHLELEGIFNRLGKHKATASYTPESTDTRTVKDWLIEIISLTDVGAGSEVEQATSNSNLSFAIPSTWRATNAYSLKDYAAPSTANDRMFECTTAGISGLTEPTWDTTVGNTTNDGTVVWTCRLDEQYVGGQRLTISDRRVTKLAFKLRKVGNPSGAITFKIYNVDSDDPLVGGDLLASKVLGDAFNLDTAYGWQEVTFDTPVLIDDDVRLVCQYQGGDASNYIELAYNSSSVLASEQLTEIYTGDWTDHATYDAVYRYTYDATPITVYDEFPAYGLVFDSEDDLIDAFIPADTFRIGKDETRLQKIKELLRYTDCIARAESDGLIYIRVPTTSGTTYDQEFTLVEGRDNQNFFSKRSRRRIVSPNKVVFKNHPSHDDSYTGNASDASAALDDMLEIETHYIRATSNAQCTNLATARLSKAQMEANKGVAVLPFVHFGLEEYDYVNFVDARADDNKAGNVGFTTLLYESGKANPLSMTVGFGRAPLGIASLLGLKGETPDQRLTVENLIPLIDQAYSYIEQIIDILAEKVDIDDLNEILLALYEDGYFRNLTATLSMTIPSEAA